MTAARTDPVEFVRGLVLAETPVELVGLAGAAPPAVTEGDKAGYVDAGSLISFVAGIPLQHKQDVLNSTLLAQLAANAKYNREKETKEWYAWYREVLENVGWVIGKFTFTDYESSGVEFTADKVILKILEAIATGNDLAVVAATMEALNSLGDEDPAVKIFETSSHTANEGAFQIGAAAESDGVVVLKVGAFFFTTTQTVTRILWFRFESGTTSFAKGDEVINLDDQIYAQVRELVIEKLGDRAITFVKQLKI
jgi:hypothetical protein